MKKICFYTNSIYTLGGIQRVVTELANNLYNEYDITIVCHDNSKWHKKFNYNLNKNINVKSFNEKYLILDNIFFFPVKCLKFLIRKTKIKNKITESIMNFDYKFLKRRTILKYFNSQNYDYILAEGLSNCIYLSNLKDKIPSKIIGCWHSSFDNYIKQSSEKYIIKSLKSIDTIVLSKYDADLIKKRYNIDVKYIYNFINDNEVEKSSLNNKYMISIGRYHQVKGYERLIKIFKKLNNNEWKLLIIGDGPEKNKLAALIDKYHLNNNVILTGGTNNVEKYYRQASIFLMTSYGEGFPMVILEAMKYGLPIIAYDIPVLHEILPSEDYIIKQDDEESYVKLLKKLCDDAKLRVKSGQLNLKKCENFYGKKIISQWKNVLK